MTRRLPAAIASLIAVAILAACTPRFQWSRNHDAAPRNRLMLFVTNLDEAYYPDRATVLSWNNARLVATGERACSDLDQGSDPVADLSATSGLTRKTTARITREAVRELCPRHS